MVILKTTAHSQRVSSDQVHGVASATSYHRRVPSTWKNFQHSLGLRIATSRSTLTRGAPTPQVAVHEHRIEYESSPAFDILFGDSDRQAPQLPLPNVPSRHQHSQSLPKAAQYATFTLVPLSTAQCRDDIRRRAEGFEMKDEPEAALSAIEPLNLISLRDALARPDIRRREEEFERTETRSPAVTYVHLSARRDVNVVQQGHGELSGTQSLSPASTMPSIYSTESWSGGMGGDIAVLPSPPNGLGAANPFLGKGGGDSCSSMGEHGSAATRSNVPGRSFEEESFMRMAAPLGW